MASTLANQETYTNGDSVVSDATWSSVGSMTLILESVVDLDNRDFSLARQLSDWEYLVFRAVLACRQTRVITLACQGDARGICRVLLRTCLCICIPTFEQIQK